MANILKFDELENIEYRKGSSKFGGLIMKIMEYLRLYKSDENELSFNIDKFVSQSNISIADIKELLEDKDLKTLIYFTITIDDDNNTIQFSNLRPQKMRFFESFN